MLPCAPEFTLPEGLVFSFLTPLRKGHSTLKSAAPKAKAVTKKAARPEKGRWAKNRGHVASKKR